MLQSIDQDAYALSETGTPPSFFVKLWHHYKTLDDAGKMEWETVFDTPRETILHFLSRRTISQMRSNYNGCSSTKHYVISKNKTASSHPETKPWINFTILSEDEKQTLMVTQMRCDKLLPFLL